MLSRVRAYVTSSPLAHVIISAFIGGALPVIMPMLTNSADLSFPTIKVVLYAAVAAGIRAAILAIPTRSA